MNDLNGSVAVGEEVTLGRYENDGFSEPISWRVLSVKEGKALLITERGIDCKRYHGKKCPVTWQTSSLRAWLNGEFLQSAFSEEEAKRIVLTTVSPDQNPQYATDPGAATQDKVFLLSAVEAESYFACDSDRAARPTMYAEDNGAYCSDGNCYWLLRTPGKESKFVCYVTDDGSISLFGDSVCSGGSAIRPAVWVELG